MVARSRTRSSVSTSAASSRFRLSPREIAPAEFLPHAAEEAVSTQPDQADPMVRAAYVHRLAGRESSTGLPVEGDQEIVRPSRDRLDHDPEGRRHDERANREGVRGNGGDDE